MHFFRHRRTAAFGGNTAGQSLWLIWYTCHKSFHINVLIILRLEIIKFIHKASLLTAYNEGLPHTQGKMEGRQKEVPPQPHKHHGAEKLRLRNPLSHTHLAFIKMNRNINTDLKIRPPQIFLMSRQFSLLLLPLLQWLSRSRENGEGFREFEVLGHNSERKEPSQGKTQQDTAGDFRFACLIQL